MALAEQIRGAAERIRPWIRRTPVERSLGLEARGPRAVFLKLECQQQTGSFKLRGAVNKLLSLPAETRAKGVVAASTGNHGMAVACAGRALGSPVTVFVPEGAAPGKLGGIRTFGGEIRVQGADPVEAERAARAWADGEGLPYVSPYNDLDVVAGQGTVAVELLEQAPQLDAVFVSLGGGGLAAGIGAWLRHRRPNAQLITCSPANSAVMHRSMKAGRILDMPSKPTLSDGTAGGMEADAITFELCRDVVDRSLLVEEQEIAAAMRWVLGSHHVLIEGAAGVAVAGFLQVAQRWAGQRVGIVLCGANVDLETLARVIKP